MRRNIVGQKVREARARNNPPITQTELAARLQVIGFKIEQPAIAKIEAGTRPVADFEVVALARALGVDVEWLLQGDDWAAPSDQCDL